jgi:hypothetical protein
MDRTLGNEKLSMDTVIIIGFGLILMSAIGIYGKLDDILVELKSQRKPQPIPGKLGLYPPPR